MQQQVGLAGFFEGRLERRDQSMRQVTDEADRVGQKRIPAATELPAASARVESREQFIFDQDARLGERVHERALAGVGVADERDGRHIAATGDLAFLARLNFAELGLELLDAMPDQPAVFLELLFARPAHADTPLVPREVGPHSLQPWHGIFQLGQLDLQMGLVGQGVRCEDIQDHLGAIDHLDPELLLEVAGLRGTQVVVEQDHVGLLGLDRGS